LREIFKDDRYKADKVIANFANILLRGRLYDELHLMNEVPEVTVTASHITNIEIFAKDSGKDVAIKEIARMYGIDMQNVMAIGDNDNDVEMLKAAGVSVAMGNATDSAKKVADFVTKTNDEDGAVFAIEKLVLDKRN
ncbi:MAG: HAD-IIB family hydrolase, partial [Erysipelotrichaceae bacterium]|nr:HAD-IIB family hydrolase [Erysipelotrichaceae bacterium]